MAISSDNATYNQSLIQAGLSPEEALIYECLIKNGSSKAGKIALKTPLKRGLVYKTLDLLENQGLVIKHEDKGKVAVFE